jgi:ribonuclease-3
LEQLRELLDALPEDLARQAVMHSSWTERRAESYERLAFLGDSVLGLAVTTHLYPRLEADRYGAGELTKVRAQAVSGRACRAVAERLGLPARLLAAAPPELATAPATEALARTERALASITEAVIGACYLTFGIERTAAAVVEAFQPELEEALAKPGDSKSALQERLARRGEVVVYEVIGEEGPPHDPTFEVAAMAHPGPAGDPSPGAGRELARGSGRSKKEAEQAAAEAALASMA